MPSQSHSRHLFLPSLGLALLLEGCGASTASPAHTAAPHPRTAAIAIRGYAFHPAMLIVAPGTRITWTNVDADNHTVTADGGSATVLTSGTLVQHKTYSTILSRAGTFHYHCSFHPFMKGTIVVRKG